MGIKAVATLGDNDTKDNIEILQFGKDAESSRIVMSIKTPFHYGREAKISIDTEDGKIEISGRVFEHTGQNDEGVSVLIIRDAFLYMDVVNA